MILNIYLRDTRNGNTAVRWMNIPDNFSDHDIDFYFGEGNYSCDCNRSLLMYGDDEIEDDEEDDKLLECNCGDNIILIDKIEDTKDGRLIELYYAIGEDKD
jgi:hypothetical protein